MIQKFDATRALDPDHPETMTVTATADPASLETLCPDPAHDVNARLTGPEFWDMAQFPKVSFTPTDVHLTGDRTAEVTAI
jgi:polyisoprenoid-binding protein YceI